MPYTPPDGDDVALNHTGAYTPPAGNSLLANFTEFVAAVRRRVMSFIP